MKLCQTFDKILEDILSGNSTPPGLKTVEWSPTLQALIAHVPRVEKPYFILGGDEGRIYHPTLFLEGGGMGGDFKGSGVVMTWNRFYSFAICEHDWDNSRGNPIRGYHYAVCRKCGFDATIDSGD